MYLRKTIVLVALAAATVAPSAMALRLPPEAGDPSQLVLAGAGHKKAHPNAKQPTLCVRGLETQTRCLAFGF